MRTTLYPSTLCPFSHIARSTNLFSTVRKFVAAELRRISTSTDRPHGEWRIEVCDELKNMGILLVGVQDVYTGDWISIEPIRANQKVKESIVYAYFQVVIAWGPCYLLSFNLWHWCLSNRWNSPNYDHLCWWDTKSLRNDGYTEVSADDAEKTILRWEYCYLDKQTPRAPPWMNFEITLTKQLRELCLNRVLYRIVHSHPGYNVAISHTYSEDGMRIGTLTPEWMK